MKIAPNMTAISSQAQSWQKKIASKKRIGKTKSDQWKRSKSTCALFHWSVHFVTCHAMSCFGLEHLTTKRNSLASWHMGIWETVCRRAVAKIRQHPRSKLCRLITPTCLKEGWQREREKGRERRRGEESAGKGLASKANIRKHLQRAAVHCSIPFECRQALLLLRPFTDCRKWFSDVTVVFEERMKFIRGFSGTEILFISNCWNKLFAPHGVSGFDSLSTSPESWSWCTQQNVSTTWTIYIMRFICWWIVSFTDNPKGVSYPRETAIGELTLEKEKHWQWEGLTR